MFGKEYVAQHILQIIKAEQEEKLYRAYVTDTLRFIAENAAVPAAYFTKGDRGKYPQRRWLEVFDPPQEENQTAEEVIEHIRKKLAT